MGADFIIRAVSVAPPGRPLDWEAGTALLQTLRNLPISQWPESLTDCEAGTSPADGQEDDVDRKQIFGSVEAMMATIRSIHETVAGDFEFDRELVCLQYPDRHIYIVGGMSWGDDPTEAYRAMARFIDSGIADAIGFDSA
jgi:hypothetical protein